MSSESNAVFTKKNLDLYLKELSKEYKKLGGRNIPVEIILIGGAAIVGNYGFREMTADIDAIYPAASIMKEAINHVGDRFGLPNGWLNADFMKTASYSYRLSEYSVPYRVFNQVLQVRMVTGEYLIAMKLRSGRKYKNDLSDIVGILAEQEQMGNPIDFSMIDKAVANLYGGWDNFSKDSIMFIHAILEAKGYTELYEKLCEGEAAARDTLLSFQENYPNVMNEENVDSILAHRNEQGGMQDVLVQLRERKKAERSRRPRAKNYELGDER